MIAATAHVLHGQDEAWNGYEWRDLPDSVRGRYFKTARAVIAALAIADTHPKDGDVKQAPLAGSAGRQASPNLSQSTNEGKDER